MLTVADCVSKGHCDVSVNVFVVEMMLNRPLINEPLGIRIEELREGVVQTPFLAQPLGYVVELSQYTMEVLELFALAHRATPFEASPAVGPAPVHNPSFELPSLPRPVEV